MVNLKHLKCAKEMLLQRSTELLLRKGPFQRLVREIAGEQEGGEKKFTCCPVCCGRNTCSVSDFDHDK